MIKAIHLKVRISEEFSKAFKAIAHRLALAGEISQENSLITTSLQQLNRLSCLRFRFWRMFIAYHAIMFAVLLIGGAGVIFQASLGEESLADNPIPVKVTESKFDLNTY